MIAGVMWCSQCKRDKAYDQFLTIKKPGWRVTKCNACSGKNMAMWERGREMDPNKVKGSDE